ncbi:MAG: hypothetical protein NT107_01795 [Planctomycetota bacterium]|nr:hypothetical protein [Planctomycetota bacterium]
MTDLIDQLKAQHEDLRLALGLLRRMADQIDFGVEPPAADCALVLSYLLEFTFAVHMPLEAKTVLATVAAHGDGLAVECVGEILRTQSEAKSLLDCLRVMWGLPAGLALGERAGMSATIRALDRILFQCMKIEEDQLFVAAMRPPADDLLDWHRESLVASDGGRGAECWRQTLQGIADRLS